MESKKDPVADVKKRKKGRYIVNKIANISPIRIACMHMKDEKRGQFIKILARHINNSTRINNYYYEKKIIYRR